MTWNETGNYLLLVISCIVVDRKGSTSQNPQIQKEIKTTNIPNRQKTWWTNYSVAVIPRIWSHMLSTVTAVSLFKLTREQQVSTKTKLTLASKTLPTGSVKTKQFCSQKKTTQFLFWNNSNNHSMTFFF